MNNTWLILDCDYLCHRALYTTGELKHRGAATGVIYGFLREVIELQKQFKTNNIIFCFDSKYSKRKEIYPQYKANRHTKKLTPDEVMFEAEFYQQKKLLRTKYLKLIGYKNVFVQKGYEADDLIARICLDNKNDKIIIVSSDKDLYQLLCANVRMYNPMTHKTMNSFLFERYYNIKPFRWVEVKCLAGCSSDNIKGIKGIGEKTALKYITNKLKIGCKKYMDILNNTVAALSQNKDLVALPFKGTKKCTLHSNKLSKKGWRKVCVLLGFNSIKNEIPF